MAVRMVWHDAAVRAWAAHNPKAQAALDRVAERAAGKMRELCPVARPAPPYPGGWHRPGDRPPVPGRLRASIAVTRDAGGGRRIGPTGDQARIGRYVNDGTPPHLIRSHGPWPLRSTETGQVFGPLVAHPGTRGAHFIERTAAAMAASREVIVL